MCLNPFIRSAGMKLSLIHIYLQEFLFASNGVNLIDFDDEGNITVDIDNKNVMNALQFANDLYNKYKVVAPNGDRSAQFNNRTVAVLNDVQRFSPEYVANTTANGSTDVTKVVPYPVGPDADGKYRTWLNDISFGIPAGCKNPEASAYLIKKCIQKMNEATKNYQWNEPVSYTHLTRLDRISSMCFTSCC